MNGTLTPNTAATVAARVYQIRKSGDFSGEFHTDFEKNFDLTNNQIKGISGGLINQLLNRQTGFALTAEGITPAFKQHHIIAIRGTHFPSLSDWLTNLNIGITGGPKGVKGHAGFQKTFRSLRPAFNEYINQHQPRCIHCVGHSLGGALAQLTALWASERGIPTKLYTFGAPRVVLNHSVPIAQAKIEHHRMVHGADPVPKVPLWPFSHTTGEYLLGMGNSARMSIGAHLMDKSPGYSITSSAYSDFGSMSHRFTPLHTQRVELRYENRHQVNFSQRWQQRISDALISLLKDTGQYSAISLQASLGLGLSFYDILARCLEEVGKASSIAYEQLKGLLGHMLVFVGKTGQKVGEITVQFIRWVFELMVKSLYRLAKSAINSVF